jgi:hypothetical protein
MFFRSRERLRPFTGGPPPVDAVELWHSVQLHPFVVGRPIVTTVIAPGDAVDPQYREKAHRSVEFQAEIEASR